ncbi:hypothetical protein ELAC_0036 [Estrella lausannensis]|uniref:Uncharacterized protein n=1 Tax=Estrella lausannensis TaxID=483423 RepID=A0A0H5E2I5_9BACT|nr:hypothetical protein ELAC_0036 [Estrella lausannensis]
MSAFAIDGIRKQNILKNVGVFLSYEPYLARKVKSENIKSGEIAKDERTLSWYR